MNNDRTISFVIGGTRGIGLSISDVLRERGDRVITASRRTINSRDHVSIDLSVIDEIANLPEQIDAEYINNLIFCCRYRGDSHEEEIQVSLNSIYYTVENLESKLAVESSIVIIGSNAGRFVSQEQSFAYHATRAAQESTARYLAVKLGPHGTRCNCIMPGGTIIKKENEEYFTDDISVKSLLEEIRPIKKMGNALDVAYLAEFLCSDKASFITGQCVLVDGGMSVVSQESLARILRKLPH